MNQSRSTQWLISQNSNSQESHFISILDSRKKEQTQKATTISVTAGKGGVGKTTIALKLAKELTEQGHRVLLIDCDYNLSNTAIKLGLPIQDSFLALISAEKTFDDCLYKDGNFHLLAGCNGNLEIFEKDISLEQIIMDIISVHEQEYDYIILDCPAGLQKETLTINAYCDHRFIVVTPDKSSITDSYSLIKILKQKYKITENHLIVNRYDNNVQFSKVVNTLSETIENFLQCRTYILGGIPKCDCLVDRFDKVFFNDKKALIHKKFLKVLKRYSERWGRPVGGGSSQSTEYQRMGQFEQDVQQF